MKSFRPILNKCKSCNSKTSTLKQHACLIKLRKCLGTHVHRWSRQLPKCIQKVSKMSPKTIQIPKCLLNVSKISPKSIQNQNVSKNSPTFFQKLFKECPKPKMYLKCLQTHLKKVCKKCPNPNGPVVSLPQGLMQQII